MVNQQPVVKKPQLRIRTLLIILIIIIVFIGVYVGYTFIKASSAVYPKDRLCSATIQCADYCSTTSAAYAAPTTICYKKNPSTNTGESTFNRWLTGKISIIEFFNPNHKYCQCAWTGGLQK